MLRLLLALFWTVLAAADASAADGPVGRFLGFFRWTPAVPPAARTALDAYRDGRFLEAVAVGGAGLRAGEAGAFRDDLLLLRGLALAEVGWRREAAETFAALLELPEPSPYYPLALLELVECRHQEGRLDAVAEAYSRHAAKAWSGASPRWRRIRGLLEAYGDLRAPSASPTHDERELALKPALLAEKLHGRKERPSERLLYLVGFDLFRLGKYRESLGALERIGRVSFYRPYALYTAAQDLYALGDASEARKRIEEILSFPASGAEEGALAERAGVFLAQMLLAEGRVDEAIASALLAGDGHYAALARLLRAETILSRNEPSLAIAYYRDLREVDVGPELAAARALGLGAAHAKLGDPASASRILEAAVAELRRARDRPDGEEVASLRSLAEKRLAGETALAAARRSRVAAGLERVWAFKGPLSIGKLVRVLTVSHEHSVVGEPVYDLALLEERERSSSSLPEPREDLWLDYLGHPERRTVEELLEARAAVEHARRGPEAAFRILAAALRILEADPNDEAAAAIAARTTQALGEPLPAEVAGVRTRLLTGDPARVPSIDAAELDDLRSSVTARLEAATASSLLRVLDTREKKLRRIEFDLEAELSKMLAAEQRGIRSAGEARH